MAGRESRSYQGEGGGCTRAGADSFLNKEVSCGLSGGLDFLLFVRGEGGVIIFSFPFEFLWEGAGEKGVFHSRCEGWSSRVRKEQALFCLGVGS